MKNIINLIKYNNYFKRNSNISSIIFGIIALIAICIPSFVSIGSFSLVYINIPIVAVALVVNFIDSIVNFAKSFSKDKARWEFLFPVSGFEYLLSKYIEFAVFQLGFTTLVALISLGSSATGSEIESVALICYGIAIGMISGYITITSVISIVCCYFDKTAVRLVFSIIGVILFSSVSGFFERIVNWIFPYVYMNINGFVTIGIFETIVSIVLTVGLVIVAMKHIDRSLEIK
jgi:hypothetical protein